MARRRNDSPLRLLSYARVSAVRGRDGPGFISERDQFERNRSYAKTYGHKIIGEGSDLDVGGGKMSRPIFDRFLTMIADGKADGLIVAKLDRFARSNAGALAAVEAIENHGGKLISVAEQIDTSSAAGKFLRSILFAAAEWERERIGDGWLAARTSSVRRGIHDSPYVPSGYVRGPRTDDPNTDRRLKPHRKHGATIRQAYTMARQGASYTEIADYLNERELPVTSIKNGERETYWTAPRIRRLLANRVYLGEARSGEGIEPNANAHAPLVDETTWLLAQQANRPSAARLRRPNRNANVPPSILSGLARCAGCSLAMKPQGAGKTSPSIYRCVTTSASGRCAHPATITKARLEDFVLKEVMNGWLGAIEISATPVDDDEERGRRLAEASEAERVYRYQLANPPKDIPAEDQGMFLASLYREWQEKLVEAEELEPLEGVAALQMSGRDLIESLRDEGNNERVRGLLSSVIAAVFVRPAESRARNLPVADRVKIVWRHDDEELELPTRGRRFEPREYVW
jgi:site-specific DNA recombinase